MSKSTTETVAAICLYGTRQTGFGTISQVKDHAGTFAEGYDPQGVMGHTSATIAIWAAVEMIREMRRGPRGMVAIHRTIKVPGGNRPEVAIVPIGEVPPFGSLKFESDGTVC